jgi:putative transposase
MKNSRFTAQQIVGILTEATERDTKLVDPCRKHGITEQTYCRWRRAYGGLEVSEVTAQARWDKVMPTRSRLADGAAQHPLTDSAVPFHWPATPGGLQ